MNATSKYVLKALVPYSRENLMLSFHPRKFFREMEKEHNIKANAARSSYYRAIERGLIEIDNFGIPRLTDKGRLKIAKFDATKLKDSHLMIIFDIPESERWKRRHLRALLRELSFLQVQKSVWVSEYDAIDYLKMEIEELGLEKYLQLFEAKKIL